jgi:hypothetical protein
MSDILLSKFVYKYIVYKVNFYIYPQLYCILKHMYVNYIFCPLKSKQAGSTILDITNVSYIINHKIMEK